GAGEVDEVEVGEGEAAAVGQPPDGVAATHEQTLRAAGEVDGGGLGVDDAGQGGQAARGGPLLGGEQHGGGAVRERGGVARGHGGVVAARCAERGAELAVILQRGVRTDRQCVV